MAVANRLSNKTTATQKKDAIAVFQANGMEVKLTPELVRNYLVSGDKDKVTMQEIAMFINLCKYSGLNPWLKEAYCIKYGSEPATMVTGKEAFTKRADKEPAFDGMKSGIAVMNNNTGDIEYREGMITLPEETIIGGWAEVFRKERAHSTRIEVSFDEYAARRKDGSLNQQWSKKPATMIRKVAIVQALREAFPQSFGGMLAAEEVGQSEPETAGMPEPGIEPETGEIVDAEVVEKKAPATKKKDPEPAPEPEDPFDGM